MLLYKIQIPHKLAGLNYHRTKSVSIPENWSELKTRHYPALQTLFNEWKAGDPPQWIFGELFCNWAKIDTLYALSDQVAFDPTFLTVVKTFQEQINHEKPLLTRWTIWKGPGDTLANICYEQFIYAEECFREWQLNNSTPHRDALIALTFRNTILPWSKKTAATRQHIVKKLPEGLRIKMAYTYVGQRNKLPALYPELFDGKSPMGAKLKIDQMILAQADGDLGKYNLVRKLPCNLVLEKMQANEMAQREAEKNRQRNAKKHN